MDDSILLSLLFLWRSLSLQSETHYYRTLPVTHLSTVPLTLLLKSFYFLLFLMKVWINQSSSSCLLWSIFRNVLNGPDAFSQEVWFKIKTGSPTMDFLEVWTIPGKQTSASEEYLIKSANHLQSSHKSTKPWFFVQNLRRDFKLKGFVCPYLKSSGFSLTLKLYYNY